MEPTSRRPIFSSRQSRDTYSPVDTDVRISADFFYAGQRRDVLVRGEAGYRIAEREIIMDIADINVPTLGLLL